MSNMGQKGSSAAQLVQAYIAKMPTIRSALRRGVVNYSALAREIAGTHKKDQFDALLVAIRRLAARLQKESKKEEAVTALIRGAKLRVRTRIAVVAVARQVDQERLFLATQKIKQNGGDCTIVEGEQAITIITNDDQVRVLRSVAGSALCEVRTGLVQVVMLFSAKITTTPGVVAHLYSLLFERGINILEEVSCWNELMVVLTPEDLPLALEVIQ